MGLLSLVLPTIGQPDSTEDPKINNALTAVQTWANGNIDAVNLSAALAQSVTANQAGQVSKGSSIVATSQNTSSASYTTLTTPDQVSNVVLPTAGLISVWFHATWQESVNNAARAALFLGANQLKAENEPTGSNPAVQEASINAANGPNVAVVLATGSRGLISPAAGGTDNTYLGDVSTGQLLGSAASLTGSGPSYVFANAGTYTITVQFKTSSGTVTASNRRLYVQAVSFA